jgi:hypothetical protein
MPAHKLISPKTSQSSRGNMNDELSMNAMVIRVAPIAMTRYERVLGIRQRLL